VSDQVLLRDLVAIPDEVHAGDFVLSLAKGVGEKSTITDCAAGVSLNRPKAADGHGGCLAGWEVCRTNWSGRCEAFCSAPIRRSR
jgi:hypothetical protein